MQGRVRSWVSLDGGSLLLFNMRDNRYCGNVARAHRSNGVFYVVDLQHDAWYQKCYDMDCRQYRSPAAPLPPHLCGLWLPPPAASGSGLAAAQACAAGNPAVAGGGAGDAQWGACDVEHEVLDEQELAAVEQAEQWWLMQRCRQERERERVTAAGAQHLQR